jgi:ssRNA-specific RNase YbeY (16S rRNA maturation enzyme)
MISALKEASLITKMAKETQFEITAVTKKGSEKVKARIISKDSTENVLTFDLKFENANQISKGTSQDKLVVKVISDVQSMKKGMMIYLPYEAEVSALIPPQIS